MTGTAEFEIDLLKEKAYVISTLNDLNSTLLGKCTYLDKKLVLLYYEEFEELIMKIDNAYEMVRGRGKEKPQATPDN